MDNLNYQSQAVQRKECNKILALIDMDTKQQIDQYIFFLLLEDFKLIEFRIFTQETLNITYKREITKIIPLKFLNLHFKFMM